MSPKYHIFIGFIMVLILFLFGLDLSSCLIIFLASVLIDIDHYLFYVYKKKDLNLRRAYNYFVRRMEKWRFLPAKKREKYKKPIIIFHGVEFFLLLIFFSYINPFFYLVFIGIAIHMCADYSHLLYIKEPLYSKLSQIYVYITNKNKKKFIE